MAKLNYTRNHIHIIDHIHVKPDQIGIKMSQKVRLSQSFSVTLGKIEYIHISTIGRYLYSGAFICLCICFPIILSYI